MPISRQNFIQATLALLIVGMLALVGIIATTIWLVDRTQHYSDEVVKSRGLRASTSDLFISLQNAETGQRGYLLTGQESYLDPYNLALTRIPEREKRLRQFATDPEDAALAERAITIIDGKIAELQQTIDLYREGKGEEALTIVRTDRGKELMDEARRNFATLLANAETRLNTRLAEQSANAETLWWTTIGGGLAILAVTLTGAFTIIRYTRELVSARKEVEALAVGLEERVKERTSDLARANEEVQRFAYIVTHDLRAPLVNIMGFTSELEGSVTELQRFIDTLPPDGLDPSFVEARRAAQEDVPEALGFIRSSTRKMDGLINAILKLSREGRRVIKPEEVDLRSFLESAGNSIAHQLGENGGTIEISTQTRPLIADRLSLEQIVGNLLDNAVKYRSSERPLRIRVTARPAPADRVRIAVEDNGRGIADQDHERVFELFRRSGTQDTAGEGIGLAHVRALVRNLGGDVTVASRLGEGTIFTIDLPRDVRGFVGSKAA